MIVFPVSKLRITQKSQSGEHSTKGEISMLRCHWGRQSVPSQWTQALHQTFSALRAYCLLLRWASQLQCWSFRALYNCSDSSQLSQAKCKYILILYTSSFWLWLVRRQTWLPTSSRELMLTSKLTNSFGRCQTSLNKSWNLFQSNISSKDLIDYKLCI